MDFKAPATDRFALGRPFVVKTFRENNSDFQLTGPITNALAHQDFRRFFPNYSDWKVVKNDSESILVERGRAINFDAIPFVGGEPAFKTGINHLQQFAKTADDLHAHTFHDVFFVQTNSGFALFREDELLETSSAIPNPETIKSRLSSVRHIENGFCTSDAFSGGTNICHYLFDHMGRCLLAQQLLGFAQKDVWICQPMNKYQDFVRDACIPESLLLMREQIYFFRSLTFFQDSFGQLNHPARHCDDRILGEWRNRIFAALGPLKPHEQNRPLVYLSRRDADVRPLENEDALIDLLSERGFAIIEMSKLTPADQINLMRSARTIIAPHGAALTSIAFCDRGTRIIELFNPTKATSAYYKLSIALGLDYSAIVGSASDRNGSDRWTVDVKMIGALVA